MKTGQIITVVDIGSTKVSCCIAKITSDENFSILGVGYCACTGVKSGIIFNVNSVSESIVKAIEGAEKSAELNVKSVFVSVSGRYISSRILNAKLDIGGRIIKQKDIVNLLFRGVPCHDTEEVIHSIPLVFEIDDLKCLVEPIGMVANTLKASLSIVTVPKTQLDNIVVSLSKCYLEVAGIIYGGYASGLCVLKGSQRSDNVIVIDFGGGVTSVNFFYKGTFCHSEVIPLGGQNITNDIAYGLNVSVANAERLKTLYGAAFVSWTDDKDIIMVPVIEEDSFISLKQMSKSELNRIIQPRVEEILKLVKDRIDNSPFKNEFSNEVIITGGGSLLTGIREFTAEFLKKNVKMKRMENIPYSFGIPIDNSFATLLGMIRSEIISDKFSISKSENEKQENKNSFWKKIMKLVENNL